MVEDMFVCFCYRQLQFVWLVVDLKLINPTAAGGARHPITDEYELFYQKYTANKYINGILQWIFRRLMNQVGKERYQRMIDCGAMKPATLSKEEIEAMGDVCLSIYVD